MNGWILAFLVGGVIAEVLAWLTVRAVEKEHEMYLYRRK